jgi:hypothetical protein
MKPQYSIDAPDQQRLKIARAKIESILREHDIAGVVALHTPGMTEFFYDVCPSYSCAWIDDAAGVARVKSSKASYGGDIAAQRLDQTHTANMAAGLADTLARAALTLYSLQSVVDQAFGAEHTPAQHVPDPLGTKQ